MKKLVCFNISLLLLLLTSTIPYGVLSNTETSINDTLPSLSASNKEWTVLVYMSGDNDLEYAAIDDIREMESGGGSSFSINVIAMIDRSDVDYEVPEYAADWSEARYYQIEYDTDPTLINSPMNQSLGEVNMGDPQTLRDFVNWGLTNYPSNKTALIIWDHGSGIDGVCWDYDANDFLTIDELETALNGYYFDLLAFDACAMGHLEVLYEMEDFCDVFVSSLYDIPFDGFPYNRIVTELIAIPTMTAAEFADVICFEYDDFYKYDSIDVTISAYDVTALTDLESHIDKLSEVLINSLPTFMNEITMARMSSFSYLPDFACEFYEFLLNLIAIGNPTITSAAINVTNLLDSALIATESNLLSDPYGLWIFLPALPYMFTNDFYIFSNQTMTGGYTNIYYDLEFVSDTSWDNFLLKWRVELETFHPKVTVPGSYSSSLSDGAYTYLYADLPDPGDGYAYQATLSMDAGVDFDIAAWNEESYWGVPGAISAESYNEVGISETLLLPAIADTRVVFYLYSYSGTGSFTLSISLIEFEDDIYEENDDIYSAALLELNTDYDLIANDDDFFYVSLEIDQYIEVILDFNPTLVDLDLYLIDEGFNIVAYSESYTETEELSYQALYTGIYFVLVSYFEGETGEHYTLSINSDEDPVILSVTYSP
ncbi:MAG: clostripain-related cysteine peptidase, partial [Candidatus Heimdallarchaeaceae archaeon]